MTVLRVPNNPHYVFWRRSCKPRTSTRRYLCCMRPNSHKVCTESCKLRTSAGGNLSCLGPNGSNIYSKSKSRSVRNRRRNEMRTNFCRCAALGFEELSVQHVRDKTFPPFPTSHPNRKNTHECTPIRSLAHLSLSYTAASAAAAATFLAGNKSEDRRSSGAGLEAEEGGSKWRWSAE